MRPRFGITGSEGSGVIIDKSGDILTNEHVVGASNEANKNITVTLMDGRKFNGTVIGSDHQTEKSDPRQSRPEKREEHGMMVADGRIRAGGRAEGPGCLSLGQRPRLGAGPRALGTVPLTPDTP